MSDPIHLTLYGRISCHLCDDMEAGLLNLQRALGEQISFQLEYVDIDSDPELVARFGALVPVLMRGEHELCHYFLDEAGVRAHLAGLERPEPRA